LIIGWRRGDVRDGDQERGVEEMSVFLLKHFWFSGGRERA